MTVSAPKEEFSEHPRLAGIRLMCQASLFFSLMVIGVKMVSSSGMPALEPVFFRSFFGALMIAYLLRRKRISFFGKPKERKFLLVRGLAGFIALSLHFYTISVLPLGMAVILNYLSVVFVALFAMLFLGEKAEPFLISMILLSFAGVYLLVGGPEIRLSPGQAAAISMGVLSAVFAAIAVMGIRMVGYRESPLTVIFYFTFISAIGSLFYLPFGFQWPGVREWFAIALIVAGSYYGQLWMTLAYRRAPAALVSPFSFLTPLLSFIYGLVLWGEKLKISTLAGAGVMMTAGILISIRENRRQA